MGQPVTASLGELAPVGTSDGKRVVATGYLKTDYLGKDPRWDEVCSTERAEKGQVNEHGAWGPRTEAVKVRSYRARRPWEKRDFILRIMGSHEGFRINHYHSSWFSKTKVKVL